MLRTFETILDFHLLSYKQLHAVLSVIYLEAAKHDEAAEMMQRFFNEKCGLSKNIAETVANHFGKIKPALRDMLSHIGWEFPQLIDVEWKLDLVLKVLSHHYITAISPIINFGWT